MLSWWADSLTLLVGIERLRWQARLPNLSQRTIPASSSESGWSRSLRRLRRLGTPLRSSRAVDRGRLVSLGMNILRYRSVALVGSAS